MDRSILYSSPHEPRTVFCILALKGSDLYVQLSVLKIKPLFPIIHPHAPSDYGGAIAVKLERRHSSKFRIKKLYLRYHFFACKKVLSDVMVILSFVCLLVMCQGTTEGIWILGAFPLLLFLVPLTLTYQGW